MGLLIAKSKTSNGNFEQRTYTDYNTVHAKVEQWKKHPMIKSVFVSKNGMDVTAEWQNGDKRTLRYERTGGEGFTAATGLVAVAQEM